MREAPTKAAMASCRDEAEDESMRKWFYSNLVEEFSENGKPYVMSECESRKSGVRDCHCNCFAGSSTSSVR